MTKENLELKLSQYAMTYNSAYVARIAKITNAKHIEGSKNLFTSMVCGYQVVFNDTVKIGDIVIFIPSGCAINKEFLSKNNLFDSHNYLLNSNKEISRSVIDNPSYSKEDKAGRLKDLCGIFAKNRKVKSITLLGEPSDGLVLGFKKSMVNWLGELDMDMSSYIGQTFDTVSFDGVDHVFCEKYIPSDIRIKEENIRINAKKPVNINDELLKKTLTLDRMIEGQFEFHTKPLMLNMYVDRLNPDDIVQISSKWHGASWIVGKVLCKKKLSRLERVKKWLGMNVKEVDYDNVYSSSKSIKNPSINPNINSFYGGNIWEDVAKAVYPFLDNGMLAYGEVVGYLPGTNEMIQEGYDYGCDPGKYKIIIYRLVRVDENGNKKELNSQQIITWVNSKMRRYHDFNKSISYLPFMPVKELYYGTLSRLYPDLAIDENWHENLVQRLTNDDRFYMNQNCHFCNNKVPTEGIVIRVERSNNKIECYKLKCHDFYLYEQKLEEKGKIDIETKESLN